MIVAEIYVPVLDASYDFKLDENVPTGVVIEEIASVICQKEQCEIGGDKTQFMLFKVENRQSLSANLTLYENGVTTGDSLVFCKISVYPKNVSFVSFKTFSGTIKYNIIIR